jgi:hypothetical protein
MNTWYMAVLELGNNDETRWKKPAAAAAEDSDATKP